MPNDPSVPTLPRIGYVTIQDVRAWKDWPKNETGHVANAFMLANVLRDLGAPLEYLGPLPAGAAPLARIRDWIRRPFPGRFLRSVEPGVLKRQAACIERRLRHVEVDVLLGNNTRPFAALRTSLPVVVWRDATFAGALKVHRDFRNITLRSIALGHRMEQAALDNCTIAVFRSQWAADDAVNVYNVDPAKVRVLPTGGNIRTPPARAQVAAAIAARANGRCELLFVGVDWEGKGGPVALEVARRLSAGGLDVRLTVIGTPRGCLADAPPFVRDEGFIDIMSGPGRQRYTELLANAHFLLLPSRVDTYGNVLPEANAFGVPCLVADSAGMPTIVRDEVNGRVFPIGGEDEVAAYCGYIDTMLRDRERYRALALAAYDEYLARLSWDVVGPRMMEILREAWALARAGAR